MNNEKIKAFFLLLIINISYANFAYSLPQDAPFPSNADHSNSDNSRLHSLREAITALDVTRTKSKKKLKQLYLKQNTTLSRDINEYSVFIEYLSYQIISYCQQINDDYGSQAIGDLPCKAQEKYFQTGNSELTGKKIKTAEEQVSLLENELMNSMGDFDEMLLKEEEHLAQVHRKTTAGSGSSTKGKNSQIENGTSVSKQETEDSNQSQGGEKQQETQTGQQQTGNNKQTENNGSGKGKQKTTGKSQSRERRKLDEIDDDIVARQLKEAAEKESDPQLKEKLWDEYYKYKKKSFAE